MKPEDHYLKFVRWSEPDVLYCPELFPWGGVCHAESEEEAYRQLSALVRVEVAEIAQSGARLPEPATRPMRESVPA